MPSSKSKNPAPKLPPGKNPVPQPLATFMEKIGVSFKDPILFERVFIHTSYVNEHKSEGVGDNERLEFLGDAVLELVTTEFLYTQFPKLGEGNLTAFRSALVKGKTLAEVSRDLGIGAYLKLSHGEEKSGGRSKEYILANALEALIGAIFLDQGFTAAHRFVSRFILTHLEDIIEKDLHIDAKSSLQEKSQDAFGITPRYQVMGESGPDHHKQFEVSVFIGERSVGTGMGSSKQAAEQSAAENALEKGIKE